MTEFLYFQSLLASVFSSLLSSWGWGTSPEVLASINRVARDHSRCCHLSTPGSASAGVGVGKQERKRDKGQYLSQEKHLRIEDTLHCAPVDGSKGRWKGPSWPPVSGNSDQARFHSSQSPRYSEHWTAGLLQVLPTDCPRPSSAQAQRLRLEHAHCAWGHSRLTLD